MIGILALALILNAASPEFPSGAKLEFAIDEIGLSHSRTGARRGWGDSCWSRE